MTGKYDSHPTAVKLREAAKAFWAPRSEEQRQEEARDPNDTAGRLRWRDLSKAAVMYARVKLAGQCIPKEVD